MLFQGGRGGRTGGAGGMSRLKDGRRRLATAKVLLLLGRDGGGELGEEQRSDLLEAGICMAHSGAMGILRQYVDDSFAAVGMPGTESRKDVAPRLRELGAGGGNERVDLWRVWLRGLGERRTPASTWTRGGRGERTGWRRSWPGPLSRAERMAAELGGKRARSHHPALRRRRERSRGGVGNQ